jgi:hypothetical protein
VLKMPSSNPSSPIHCVANYIIKSRDYRTDSSHTKLKSNQRHEDKGWSFDNRTKPSLSERDHEVHFYD